MELLVERIFAIFIAVSGPILTIFDLPGNTLLLLTSLMFAFFDEVLYFNGRLLSAMVLIYALGEFWEFCVGLFGIKRSKVSWFAVIFIALGSFAGTLLGTLIFPILGSLHAVAVTVISSFWEKRLAVWPVPLRLRLPMSWRIRVFRRLLCSWRGRQRRCAFLQCSASWQQVLL